MSDAPELQQDAQYALSAENGEVRHPKDFFWMERNVPCRTACPAGTDIPGYLEAIAQGNFEEAYRINLEDNVFPAVLGRACTRPCEDACRHGWDGLGESVAICFAKRSAETFMQNREPVVLDKLFPESGKKVVVLGGGASGLSVARELQRWGHQVTVLEAYTEAGGMMVQGIPEFRLPREIVRREIAQITALGVEVVCGVSPDKAEDVAAHVEDADAVVVALGTHKPHSLSLPGADLKGVEHGLDFLKRLHADGQTSMGERVLVVGGGFTAVDCARLSRRMGAADVQMLYRRSQEGMYIGEHELHEFETEGVTMTFCAAPVECLSDDKGHVRAVRFVRTEMETREGENRPVPVPIEGSEFVLEADRVFFGIGQATTVSAFTELIEQERVFVAGDAKLGSTSLIDSIGDGKNVSREVDKFLMGENRFETVVTIEDVLDTGRDRALNDLPRVSMPQLGAEDRGLTSEVELGFDDAQAKEEASRCYLCNYKFEIDNELCIYCDRCLNVKPVENCIVKASSLVFDEADRIVGHIPSTRTANYNLLYLDQNECVRCNACVEVCPVECITIQKVSQVTRPK